MHTVGAGMESLRRKPIAWERNTEIKKCIRFAAVRGLPVQGGAAHLVAIGTGLTSPSVTTACVLA
jgi:hypothetical protein